MPCKSIVFNLYHHFSGIHKSWYFTMVTETQKSPYWDELILLVFFSNWAFRLTLENLEVMWKCTKKLVYKVMVKRKKKWILPIKIPCTQRQSCNNCLWVCLNKLNSWKDCVVSIWSMVLDLTRFIIYSKAYLGLTHIHI